jgi:hypothetical protein
MTTVLGLLMVACRGEDEGMKLQMKPKPAGHGGRMGKLVVEIEQHSFLHDSFPLQALPLKMQRPKVHERSTRHEIVAR